MPFSFGHWDLGIVILREVAGINATDDGLSGSVAPGGIQETWLVPPRYASPETSGLTETVAVGMKPVELALMK